MSEEYLSFGKVSTSYGGDVIRQEASVSVAGVAQKISTDIMSLKEQGVKSALIKMGWTPPPSNNDQLSTVEQWKNEIHNNVAVIVDPDGDEIVMVEDLVEFLADKFGGDA